MEKEKLKNMKNAIRFHTVLLIAIRIGLADPLTITSDLPLQSGYYYSTAGILKNNNINGTYNAATTLSLTINGHQAYIESINSLWRIADNDSIVLFPGINCVTIQTYDGINGTGNELESGRLTIWYDNSNFNQLGGVLGTSITLIANDGPWYITDVLTIQSGITLTIQAGATLFFNTGIYINVQTGGCLKGEGEKYQHICLTRNPETPGIRWQGLRFEQSLENNKLAYVDMTFGDSSTQMIYVNQAQLTLEYMNWGESTNKSVLEMRNPRIQVSHSQFPTGIDVEIVHGEDLSGNDYLIFSDNIFSPTTGYNDIVDFSNCQRPGPILEFYNNIFLGGSDDGLDLDGCDAHVEGNLFKNFHKGHTGSSTSNAIATGVFEGHTSNIVVVRNIFTNNDHAVLLKEDCEMRAENNVFAYSTIAAINFDEPERGVTPAKGAYFDGNIFYENTAPFQNQFAPEGEMDPQIVVNRCIIEVPFDTLGTGNLTADPEFIAPADGNFHLEETSPAIENGPNKLDMGAMVAAGASISGEPAEGITSNTYVDLSINGPGIVSYRYTINEIESEWSEEFDIASHPYIHLTGLIDGQSYLVYVKGKNSAGKWQWDPAYTASKQWIVDISSAIHDPMIKNASSFTLTAYPNPFNPDISINYILPVSGMVTITVFDLLGRKIGTLFNGFQHAGYHQYQWDGRDNTHCIITSGTYIVHLLQGNRQLNTKILLIH
jgi:hypothetical protein